MPFRIASFQPVSVALFVLGLAQFLPEFVSSYAVLLLFLAWIWQAVRGGLQSPSELWLYAMLLFFGWQGIGLVYSFYPDKGLELLAMQLLLVVLPWQLFSMKDFRVDHLFTAFRSLWFGALLAALVLLGYGLWRTFSQPDDQYAMYASFFLYYTGLAEPLMHPAYLSLLVGLALISAWWMRGMGQLRKWWFWPGQLILLVFLMMVSARMTLLGFLVSGLLLVVYRAWQLQQKKWLLLGLLGAFLFAASFYWVLPARLQSRFTELGQVQYDIQSPALTDFNGLTIRLAEWKGVWLAMEHHWLIGHGTGAGKPALLEAYEQLQFQVGLTFGYNAHNQLLETLLGHGLVGLFLLLMVLLLAFYDAWKQRNWLGMWFLLFFFLSMQTESMLVRHRGALFFALYLALTMLVGRFSKSEAIKR